ncbi:hypothetical protein M011DRAFT_298156 [Sporormia fimetaria CBS 119925]|uniref:LIM zinc-binding domain-containing protein n=1 Tax=Sporormia fimetaria CBS 119925 TaxID=1340428 RepID=A0A6A6UYI9_9PLEO|nr:hypothetical protein M011DRAFT_298156 [Sporormia fimetaria CBS 119925]
MATERMMIKCSSCGSDIDISELADHVCPPIQQSTSLAPFASKKTSDTSAASPPKLDRAATFGSSLSPPTAFSNQTRHNRMPPPPMINPSAASKSLMSQFDQTLKPADQPFKSRDQLSPADIRHAPLRSPSTPARGRPPYKMSRSATSPMPRSPRPPSPDLPPNMDCAFPPFPVSKPASKRAKSKSRQKSIPHQHRHAEGSAFYAPLSPSLNAGENIAKRMDAIAPGPFDGRGGHSRPSTPGGTGGDLTNATSKEEENYGLRKMVTPSSGKSSPPRSERSASASTTRGRSSTFTSQKKSSDAPLMLPPLPPVSSQEDEGIDAFLQRLQKGSAPDRRSKTSTPPSVDEDRPRRPSAPETEHSWTGTQITESLRDRSADMPPTRPVKPDTSIGRPSLYTASDSGLSDGSFSSERSAASSRSSPATSMDSGQHSHGFAGIGQEAIPRVQSPESFMEPPTSARSERYPGAFTYNGAVPSQTAQQTSYVAYNSGVPESPLDPAIHMGVFQQQRIRDASNQAPKKEPIQDPQEKQESRTQPLPARSATKKGNCRGCSEPIIGKSVKDSSGRLTGRYHRQCFVCKTCRDPFPTAEFYVFENSPYCEHHYHELNGSLCQSCNRGIEGQYLETDQSRKFHPRCFTCLTCRAILQDDYYEVDGKAYCDRHAYEAQKNNSFLAPGQFQPPTSKVQKRSTRLMMMM